MASLLIYAPRKSSRLQYVLEEIFHSRYAVEFQLTDSLEDCFGHRGALVLYSNEQGLPAGVRIPATHLLFETGWEAPEPGVIRIDNIPALFPVGGSEGAWQPFDLFATVFYFLSRYEEYRPFTPDTHGRFTATQSLAYRNGFLEIPILDIWISRLADHLNETYPELGIARMAFSFIPTIDVDQMWAFLHKPLKRQIGGFALDVLRARFRNAARRLAVWTRLAKDPFDAFDFLANIHKDDPAIFFFLLADPGPFDVNNPVEHPVFGKMLRQIANRSATGLHPSYKSAGDPAMLLIEKKRLEELSGKKAVKSRQHFLRLSFPSTYRNLLEAGMEEDYSMGFADAPGFRAGTAAPFFWYDLEKESPSSLKVIPFQIMDVTLRQYLKLSPGEAVARAAAICEQVATNGGVFVSIWHNSSFDEKGDWEGWTQVYTNLLTEISYLYGKAKTKDGT